MIKTLSFIFLLANIIFSQYIDSINPIHSRENIIKFADHLFCERDYLRAAEEYLRVDEALRNETINFKTALSCSRIGDYSSAGKLFSTIKESSSLYQSSKLELMKILFLEEKYSELRKYSEVNGLQKSKLYLISFFMGNEKITLPNNFLESFDENEKTEVMDLYQLKVNSPDKNPIIASILSVIIPGAGKIYTGEISDGIVSFITTSLFAFLSYDNFKADHKFRAWLFGGLAAGFYAGNVYGSYASAQIYNAHVKYEFNLALDSFINSKNYFIPQYDFCK